VNRAQGTADLVDSEVVEVDKMLKKDELSRGCEEPHIDIMLVHLLAFSLPLPPSFGVPVAYVGEGNVGADDCQGVVG